MAVDVPGVIVMVIFYPLVLDCLALPFFASKRVAEPENVWSSFIQPSCPRSPAFCKIVTPLIKPRLKGCRERLGGSFCHLTYVVCNEWLYVKIWFGEFIFYFDFASIQHILKYICINTTDEVQVQTISESRGSVSVSLPSQTKY